ncbi:transposase [Alkalihalophilus pseudofirmus OF4]|uniref:Transposase n=1 Tax=Alkalihalophilus pseudofirmus (strain ATCC BAA-2126 / JCM 17055 / OF4) TaxID=398511 RepID=D3FSI1_ALKPO|nr:LXG domain-containing protein [Alkalihalophilus pseudofirmus]ADC49949.1 transposase [Alkalihalophilus pseudofirmus OF4]
MKKLDVKDLQESIDKVLSTLDSKQEEFKLIDERIQGLLAKEQSFKGEGGKAIRSFYSEAHLPLLQYLQGFNAEYKGTLVGFKGALNTFEPASNGFIDEGFIKEDIQDGLERAKRTTVDLTNQTNNAMQKVDGIVSLPRLNEEEVIHHVQQANREALETVENLYTFDQQQKEKLDLVGEKLEILTAFIADLKTMFNNKSFDISQFPQGILAFNPNYRKIIDNHYIQNNMKQHLLAYYGFQAHQVADYQGLEGCISPHLAVPHMYLGQLNTANDRTTTDKTDEGAGVGNLYTYYQVLKNIDFEETYGNTNVLAPGAGNYNLDIALNQSGFNLSAGASIVDTNSQNKSKGQDESEVFQRMFYANGEVQLPSLSGFNEAFSDGDLIGGKTEAAVSHSNLAHENSPVSFDMKLFYGDAHAGIENYSAGAGAGAGVAKAGLQINPLNFFGYEVLSEVFNIDKSPYIGVNVGIGSAGASAKFGTESEIFAALGLGVGIKFGVDDVERSKEDE